VAGVGTATVITASSCRTMVDMSRQFGRRAGALLSLRRAKTRRVAQGCLVQSAKGCLVVTDDYPIRPPRIESVDAHVPLSCREDR